jgi:hypothetical protein
MCSYELVNFGDIPNWFISVPVTQLCSVADCLIFGLFLGFSESVISFVKQYSLST